MTRYIFRRILLSVPVLFGVLFAVFAIARVIPGSPCTTALGERTSPQRCEQFNREHGLDKSVPEQFVVYLGELAQGDLGNSSKDGRPVGQILIERLPLTVELSALALLFAVVLGIPLGVLSAARRNSPLDVGTMMVANLGVSIPIFVLGLLLAFLFGVILRDTPISLPPSGRLSPGSIVRPLSEVWGLQGLSGAPRALLDFLSGMYTLNGLLTLNFALLGDALRHLILPAVALGTIPLAIIVRITRAAVLDVTGEDYVRTAEAKGLTQGVISRRHVLRNALLPVVTTVGLQAGLLLSGAVLTESVFAINGLGSKLFNAITLLDYPVLQGFILAIALMYALINLTVDVLYGVIDPRVRVS